jgi:hypothetical protein
MNSDIAMMSVAAFMLGFAGSPPTCAIKAMFPCFSRKNQARMGFCSGVAMSVNIKLSENLVAEARRYAQAQHRSVPKQIEYWSRIGKIAEENPDLPFAMIRDILIAEQEEATSEYRFG